MKFSKTIEENALERDAGLVQELFRKSRWNRTGKNQEAFEKAQKWFVDKHHCGWQDFAKEQERGI